MSESPNKRGRKPRVTDADLIAVLREAEDPVLSTAEIADRVPIKRRGTLRRLRNLEDVGVLESKQIGGRNTVWWLIDESRTPKPRAEAETLADRLGGFGMLEDDAADEFAEAIEAAREEMGDAMEDRQDALFGE